MTVATQFRQKAVERRADLTKRLIEIEEGVNHSPEEIIDDAQSIGLTIQTIADASETLHKRRTAVETMLAANWQQQVDTAMQGYRDAVAAAELATAAVAEAQEACKAAHQRTEAAMNKRSEIDRKRQEAEKNYRQLMTSTAKAGASDPYDWKAISL